MSIGVYGPIKTFKTTLGLTLPKPMVDFDLDVSFDRAEARVRAMNPEWKILKLTPDNPLTEDILSSNYDLIVKQYNIPIRLPGTPVKGFEHLWNATVIPEMLLVDNHPRIKSILVDTGTVMWELARMAEFERKSDTRQRENLSRIEYARPSTEVRGLLRAPKFVNKQFISLHHQKGKYVRDTQVGFTWDGFQHMGAEVDLIAVTAIGQYCANCKISFNPEWTAAHIQHRIEQNKIIPIIQIETSGYAIESQGIIIENPDYYKILGETNLRRTLAAVEAAKGKHN